MNGQFKPIILLIFLVFISAPAFSQDAAKPADFKHVYEEDFCDYVIGFPEKPTVSTVAGTTLNDTTVSQDIINYTKIYDLDKSLSVEASCRPFAEGEREKLTERFLRKSLTGMAKQDNVFSTRANIKTRDETGERYGIIIGSRRENPSESLITYQIWMGDNSLFFLKMEAKGPEYEEKEDLFANILRNFRNKNSD